jgi:glycosyltransferase involved in cell wall biosynthesis
MEVLNVTVVGDLPEGLRAQLNYEYAAAQNLESDIWITRVFHNGVPLNAFERRLPFWARNLIGRKLFLWIYLLARHRNFDFVLNRHSPFDLFAFFFARFISNRISVHHSMELAELKLVRRGWKGILASALERVTGRHSLRNVCAVVGVTKEIALYELGRLGSSLNVKKRALVYPNAIDCSAFTSLTDCRAEQFCFLFICSDFKDWRGLDLVFENVAVASQDKEFQLHLVGFLTDDQLEQVDELNTSKGREVIVVHGKLFGTELDALLSKADVGLASFGLFRIGLHEGCTLKVREYLASGLPVYSNHVDSSLPSDFKYYKKDDAFNLGSLLNFAKQMRSVSRADVRAASMSLISKDQALNKLLAGLRNIEIANGQASSRASLK